MQSMGFCDDRDESSDSVTEFLSQVSNYQLLKKNLYHGVSMFGK
jgi:hypothetical protein